MGFPISHSERDEGHLSFAHNSTTMARVIDRIKEAGANGQPYVAFEFFPPRTADGLTNLYKRCSTSFASQCESRILSASLVLFARSRRRRAPSCPPACGSGLPSLTESAARPRSPPLLRSARVGGRHLGRRRLHFRPHPRDLRQAQDRVRPRAQHAPHLVRTDGVHAGTGEGSVGAAPLCAPRARPPSKGENTSVPAQGNPTSPPFASHLPLSPLPFPLPSLPPPPFPAARTCPWS
jgi:hypothetical protein